jgi:hypothetical protein
MKGLDAWVYDAASEQEFFAGHVEAGYFSRDKGFIVLCGFGFVCCGCQALAGVELRLLHSHE